MEIITTEDINYLAQQPSEKINLILSGMIALMNDMDNKVEVLQSQNWFQRMVKTVLGKNNLAQDEIQQNRDKLNEYMYEAITELYNKNCIENKIIMSLCIHLNELYEEQVQLQQMMGDFFGRLNEKIDSVDNFDKLAEDIEQGVYSGYSPIVAICKIVSQFDIMMLEDERKLDIIKESLYTQNIITDDEVLLSDYLMDILNAPVEEMGQIYMELATIRQNYIAKILLCIMDDFYFLPDMERKLKKNKKKMLICKIFVKEGLDSSASLRISDIYNDFINSKIEIKNSLVSIRKFFNENTYLNSETEEQNLFEDAEQLFMNCKMDEAFEVLKVLAEKGNGRAMYLLGEFYSHGYGSVVIDVKEAEKWREMGRDAGDILASLKVGYSFSKYNDERKDIFGTMFSDVYKLAKDGDVFAQYELADLYMDVLGLDDNFEAIMWYEKSARAGYWRSMNKLAFIYENEDKGLKWAKKSAEIGSADGMCLLSVFYSESEKDEKALELLEKAVDAGSAGGMFLLAEYYEGEDEEEEAFEWYKKLAEKGSAYGMCMLADCYYCGDSVDEDEEIAFMWYKRSMEAGCGEAMFDLASQYYDDVDERIALELYMKSAETGYKEAMEEVSDRYYNGEGVEKDEEKGYVWEIRAENCEDDEFLNYINLIC